MTKTYYNDKELKIYLSVFMQLRILLLEKLLTDKLGIKPHMATFPMMDDRYYVSTLWKVMRDKNLKIFFWIS